MKNKSSRFEAIANVLYVEHEVTPQTMTLKEDSFKEPAEGYSPEDWMKMDYRKRRYIVLRNRARAGQPSQPLRTPKVKQDVSPVIEPDVQPGELVDEPESDNTIIDEPEEITYNEPIHGSFVNAIVDYVSSNPNTTRKDLFNYISREFGDRLNTQDQINRTINQAVANGDIEFNNEDIAILPGTEGSKSVSSGPSDVDLKKLSVNTDEQKKQERTEILKKILAYRAAKKAGYTGKSDEDDEQDTEESDDDDENPMKPADKVLGKGSNYNRLAKAGVDWDAADLAASEDS